MHNMGLLEIQYMDIGLNFSDELIVKSSLKNAF